MIVQDTPGERFVKDRELFLPSWPSKGFSGFSLQPPPLARLKGLGHMHLDLFMVTAASMSCNLMIIPDAFRGGNH